MTASYIATTMIIVFFLVNLTRQLKTGRLFEPAYTSPFVRCLVIFVGGATLANGAFHFLHGILGFSDFPAPFSMMVKHPVFTNIANVIWGLFNFGVTTFIVLSYRSSVRKFLLLLSLSLGFIVVSTLLRFVLLITYFETHWF